MSKSDIGTLDQEKGGYDHRERLDVPGTIAEDDEDTGGNVGTAEYEKSKHMAEIVSPRPFAFRLHAHHLLTHKRLSRVITDPRPEQDHPEEDRLVHLAPFLDDSNFAVLGQDSS